MWVKRSSSARFRVDKGLESLPTQIQKSKSIVGNAFTQNRRTHYHAQLALPDKYHAIKELVVSNKKSFTS